MTGFVTDLRPRHRNLGLAIAFCAALGAGPVAAACTLPAGADALRAGALVAANRARADAGLVPLRINATLERAAQGHACDLATSGRLSHTGSDGSLPQDRYRRAGYAFRTGAENVAIGFDTGAGVTAGWMASPGHRRNLLDPDVTEAGFGLAVGVAGRVAWVLDLARPR